MNINGNGINAYAHFQNYRRFQNNPAENGNQKGTQSPIINDNQIKTNSPQQVKDEGKANPNEKIPAPNGLGSIMDLKA